MFRSKFKDGIEMLLFRRRVTQLMVVVLTALLSPFLIAQDAPADSRVITDPYNNVLPDGYWTAQVAAGGEQHWFFQLTEAREDHSIRIDNMQPEGSSLSVSIDGLHLGAITDQGDFIVSLEPGPHEVTISNDGAVPVQYDLYMGLIHLVIIAALAAHDANIDADLAAHDAVLTALGAGLGGHNTVLTAHDANIDGDLAAHDADLAAHDANIDGDLAAHERFRQ